MSGKKQKPANVIKRKRYSSSHPKNKKRGGRIAKVAGIKKWNWKKTIYPKPTL